MEFNDTNFIAREDAKQIEVPVIRTGDLSVTCSVICQTEQQTAVESEDFQARPLAESSRLFFLRGVTVVHCSIPIVDDETSEGDELFKLKLSQAQVEQLNGQAFQSNTSAIVGPRSQLIVQIADYQDTTRVYFNQSVYRSAVQADSVTLYLERAGDVRSASKVFVNTQDASAKEGRDYIVKTRQLHFGPGSRSATIDIVFLNKNTWSRSFQVTLQSLNNHTQLGPRSSATVFIPPAITTGPALLPAEPIVVSLMDYGNATVDKNLVLDCQLTTQALLLIRNCVVDRVSANVTTVPAGYPVICVTPCDAKHPLYNTSTQRLCRNMAIDVSRIRYSWEISPPRARSELIGRKSDFFRPISSKRVKAKWPQLRLIKVLLSLTQ